MKEVFEALCRGEDMSQETSRALFARIVAGELSGIQIAALVAALKIRQITLPIFLPPTFSRGALFTA